MPRMVQMYQNFLLKKKLDLAKEMKAVKRSADDGGGGGGGPN